MNIDVSFDQSVSNAPSGFVAAVNYVINYFDNLFTNPVAINIAVGYGEIEGQSLASNALGESLPGINGQAGYVYLENYAQARGALLAQNAPGASTLPLTSPASGGLAMTSAEAQALGLELSDSGLDGWVGFSSQSNIFSYSVNGTPSSNQYYFIGVVEHEFTEILGRASFLDQAPNYYSLIDLFRYSAPGVRQLSTGAPSYFSIDGGDTNLDSWNNFQTGNNGDLADWAPSAGNDTFDDNSNPGVINRITSADLTLMNALGWQEAPPLPVVTASNVVEPENAVIAASSLFTASNPAGIASYQLMQNAPNQTTGHFVVNGVAQAAGQPITVSASNLSQVNFDTTSGTDVIWVRASADGQAYSSWQSFALQALDPLPTVTASNVVEPENAVIAASSLFTASDPAGIASYQLMQNAPNQTTGYFVVNGVAQAGGQPITVSASNLSQVNFDTTSGTDIIWVRASANGQTYSSWQGFALQAFDPLPVVTASNVVEPENAVIAASSLFTASDPAGIASYQLMQNAPNQTTGYFVVNGVAQAAGQPITVSASNLSQVNFDTTSGTDIIWVRASADGQAYSSWQSFALQALDPLPTVTASNVVEPENAVIAASSLFTASDPAGIASYQLMQNAPNQTTGHFVVNGVAQAAGQPITVSASNLSEVNFDTTSGTDIIWVRASADGQAYSSWYSFTLSTPATAVGSVSGPVTITTMNSVGDGQTPLRGSPLPATVWAGIPDSSSPITINAGQTLEISYPYSDKVTFEGTTGTLKLDNSSNFTGTVAGLTGQDTIDFADINFASVQNPSYRGDSSSGTLTVSDDVQTANIALLGQYMAAGFHEASDATTGTLITYNPPSAQSSDTILAASQHT